jgi:hypothetical protein
VKEEPGRSDAKHNGLQRLMWGRTRVERMILVEETVERLVHNWKSNQCVVSQEMMVHEQRRCLRAGLDSQSFEGVTQLLSRLLNRG